MGIFCKHLKYNNKLYLKDKKTGKVFVKNCGKKENILSNKFINGFIHRF